MLRNRNPILLSFVLTAAAVVLLAACSVVTHKDKDNKTETVDIKTPFGSTHVETDPNAQSTGFSVYPGSRPHHDSAKGETSGGSVSMSMFGMNLAVAKSL